MTDEEPESDKFKEVARELSCVEDEDALDERLNRLARLNPTPEKPE